MHYTKKIVIQKGFSVRVRVMVRVMVMVRVRVNQKI